MSVIERLRQAKTFFGKVSAPRPLSVKRVLVDQLGNSYELVIRTPWIETRHFREQAFFRVTKKYAGIDESRQYSFGHPPPELTTRQRSNLAGNPAFYGSQSPIVAMRETSVKTCERVFLTLWRARGYEPRFVLIPPYHSGDSDYLRDKREQRVNQAIVAIAESKVPDRLGWMKIEVDKELSNLFLDPSDQSLSSILGHHWLYDLGFDGIEYPDVHTRNDFNYALAPNFAKKLTLARVWEVSADYSKESISVFRTANLVNDVLEWRQTIIETDHPQSILDTLAEPAIFTLSNRPLPTLTCNLTDKLINKLLQPTI